MPDEARGFQGTLLGFDFGHRRIGVAVGQTLTGTANALTVLKSTDSPDWQGLAALVAEWKPVAMVVGLLLLAGRRRPLPYEVVLVLAIAALSLRSARHAALILLAAPLAGRQLQALLEGWRQGEGLRARLSRA